MPEDLGDLHVICDFIFSAHAVQVRSKTMTAKTPEEIEMAKKFMVWHFEKHYRERAGVERVVVLFDMEGAGVANVVGTGL